MTDKKFDIYLTNGIDKRKSAANVTERQLVTIHSKLTVPYDYARSIQKTTYFDVVDVLMHLCRGFGSVADGKHVYHLKHTFRQAAEIYDNFWLQKLTLQQTIDLAFEQGRMLYFNNYGMEPFR